MPEPRNVLICHSCALKHNVDYIFFDNSQWYADKVCSQCGATGKPLVQIEPGRLTGKGNDGVPAGPAPAA